MFFKPKPERLAKNRDFGGLLKCITGGDPSIAEQAAALLGNVMSLLPYEKLGEVIQPLVADGRPPAVHALLSILKSDDPHPAFSSGGMWYDRGALALYDLGEIAALQEIILDVRQSEYAGDAFHESISDALLDRAVAKSDQPFVEFLLVNGKFGRHPFQTSAAFSFLEERGGKEAIERVVDDPALFSSNVKSTGFEKLGRKFEASDFLWH